MRRHAHAARYAIADTLFTNTPISHDIYRYHIV
jgi:hypothetical protein